MSHAGGHGADRHQPIGEAQALQQLLAALEELLQLVGPLAQGAVVLDELLGRLLQGPLGDGQVLFVLLIAGVDQLQQSCRFLEAAPPKDRATWRASSLCTGP
ncbi:MAG: hypothetical protein WKG00_04035 [Polyangiaceae bacterium]